MENTTKENHNQEVHLKNKIHICHVGGRSGWSDNPLDCLGNNVYFTLFDADEEAVKNDQAKFNSKKVGQKNYQFIATCVTSKKETRYFNINKDPFASTLYEFNENLAEFIIGSAGFNYGLKEAFQTVKKKKVKCLPLDKIFSEDSAPDFLSLDTEGSEYEILNGAERLLSSSILGIRTEVSFFRIRKNQKLFSDIMNFLLKRNFIYIGLDGLNKINHRNSLDYAKGTGFVFSSDASFIKDYKKIIKLDYSKNEKILMLFKLATISLSLNLLDYAYQILETIDKLYRTELYKIKYNYKYVQLCKDFYREYKRLMKIDFPRQKYFSSNDEFWGVNPHSNNLNNRKSINNKKTIIIFLVRKCLKKSQKKLLMKFIKKLVVILSELHYIFTPKNSIETILHKHGLVKQSLVQKRLRSKRLFHPKIMARNISLMKYSYKKGKV